MTTTAVDPQGSVPRDAFVRLADALAAAGVIAFALWLVLGVRTGPLSLALDSVAFGAIGLGTAIAQRRAARRAQAPRDRLAWDLLVGASVARFAYGRIWSVVVNLHGANAEPAWLAPLSAGYLVFLLPGLLMFRSRRWEGLDRYRYLLDVTSVLLASGLLAWLLAVGPLVRAEYTPQDDLVDRIFTFTDAITLMLAAWLHVRAADPRVRRAALWLIGAYGLRLITDFGLWQGGWDVNYLAGGITDGLWLIGWVFTFASAREYALAPEAETPIEHEDALRYRSGTVPYLFLLSAGGAYFLYLALGATADLLLLAVGGSVISGLLVARQWVEIEERNAAARTLRSQGDRRRALMQHAFDAVVLIRADGVAQYVSPATERVLGVSAADERPWALMDVVDPADVPRAEAAFTAGVDGPQRLRLRVRDREGEWRTFDGEVHDHRADPRIGAFVLNGLDRSREARLAEGLRDAEPFEALGIMAGGLSHDLNNVLTVVASHAELLSDDPDLDARARGDIAAIHSASDRARALTRGLLTLSRRKTSAWSVVSVPAVARDAAAPHEGLRVDVDEAPGCFVHADADAMRQLVAALIEEGLAISGGAPTRVHVTAREVPAAEARELRLESNRYITCAVGDCETGPADRVSEVVRTEEGGQWDLAPSDLALLMALAAAREAGGTVVREERGGRDCLVAYLPAVAL